MQRLPEQSEKAKKANQVLIQNMACLFRTAQAEVQRKDARIHELERK